MKLAAARSAGSSHRPLHHKFLGAEARVTLTRLGRAWASGLVLLRYRLPPAARAWAVLVDHAVLLPHAPVLQLTLGSLIASHVGDTECKVSGRRDCHRFWMRSHGLQLGLERRPRFCMALARL
jgi:hypothetical protein